MVNIEPANPQVKLDKIDRRVILFMWVVVVAGLLTCIVAWKVAGWTDHRFAPGGAFATLAAIFGTGTYLMIRHGFYAVRGRGGYGFPRGEAIYKRDRPITYCCMVTGGVFLTLTFLILSIISFLYSLEEVDGFFVFDQTSNEILQEDRGPAE